jgi:outer membrane protein
MRNSLVVLVALLLFGSKAFAQKYDINRFIELVKKNNKDILIAAKDLEIADAQDAMARSGAYPYIAASAGYNRNLKEAFMFFNANDLNPDAPNEISKFAINYKNEFSAGAVLNQQIFNWSVFNAIQAAEQYENLTDHAFDATRKGVVNGSRKAFYQTLLLKEIWEVNKESEKNSHENYLELKKKFDVGLVSEFQLLQAEVRWQNYIPELTKSERNYLLAINSLKTLAGIDYTKEFEIVGQLEVKPAKPAFVDMKDVLTNRSDYNAMLWEMKLRESNVDVEWSGHMPSLSASLSYQYSSMSDEFKFERQNNYLIAGLNLKIPIFSGGMTSARVQQAQIEVDQTELKISKFESEIFTEIKNLELKLTESENRIESAESTFKIAKKAFKIAEITSENGLATQLELKDARLGYDQAQLNYYASVYEYLESYFDWELAVGILKLN